MDEGKQGGNESLGRVITLTVGESISFDSLLPNHNEYIYLKIKSAGEIIAAEGDFMNDLGMTRADFIGYHLNSIEKNRELFGEYIYPLFIRSIENGSVYQFCFRIDDTQRVVCCSLYPCTIPGAISSIDCVIRPAVFKSDLDRFIVNTI